MFLAVTVHHHGESRRGDPQTPARRLRGGVSSRREAAAGGHSCTVTGDRSSDGFNAIIALAAAAVC